MSLFLRNVLIFEFLAEKIEFFGRENHFFGLHQLLMENQDSVDRVALVGEALGGGSVPLVLKHCLLEGPGRLLKSAKSLLTFKL